MSAASYYDKAATQEDQQPGPMQSGAQGGYGQDVHSGVHEQQRGFPQQGYNGQSRGGVYSGQGPNMGNSNYAQGPQQMNGNGSYAQGAQQMNGNSGNYAQGDQQMGGPGAVADDRDTLTKLLDRIEKKFGGERFNNPDNAEKNKALNANILKRVKQVMGMVVQRGPGMVMRMMR